jgi:hypothetical protein
MEESGMSKAGLLGMLVVILTMGASMNANAGLFGLGGTSWQEEVLLHDGTKIIVERSVERGGRHEIGQEPPIKEQSLRFTLPGTSEKITWHDKVTEDVGSANFLPMLLDVQNGVVYLIAHPMGCLSYNKWGRPNPPYVVFKFQNKQWDRVSLQDLPSELKTPNLIFSSPDHEAKKAGGSVVSAEAIKALYEGYRQPEYKTILREAMKNAGGSRCGEMVGNGKGRWLGIDWFKEQASLEACLDYCAQKDFSAQHCPCNSIFRGTK